jgi:hypothetical protein
MAGNAALNAAAKAKKDEFYTQLTDIEKELRHYRKHFEGKTVFCNCDDPFESNFFKYFVLNFNRLKLKKLIATCYSGSPIVGTQLSIFDVIPEAGSDTPYKAIVTKVYDKTGDGLIDMLDVAELFKSGENELTQLEGDGDFRSKECLDLMDEADIVVTNPPFSKFREYVATLMERQKDFVIIGPQNAIKYKEIFPLMRDGKMWLGYGFQGNVAFFESPYEDRAKSSQHKEGLIRVSGVMWFTNLDIKKRHEDMILYKRYSRDEYVQYDNYDAIDVPRASDIPSDYAGKMGVPITFMTQFNPDQFELIGCSDVSDSIPGVKPLGKEWIEQYRAQGGTGHYTANMRSLGVSIPKHKISFSRIIIRNKHPEVD